MEGAPRRAQQLFAEGLSFSKSDDIVSEEEAQALLNGRYAFVNVWRSIDPERPVMQKPLAVCDERTISEAHKFKCDDDHLLSLSM